MSKGKFVKVTDVSIDWGQSTLALSLECGHTLTQKRSPSYLKKQQFQTLMTPGGKPLSAHCKICKQDPGPATLEASVEKVLTLLKEAEKEFDSVFDAVNAMFAKYEHQDDVLELFNYKNFMTLQKNQISKIAENIKNKTDDNMNKRRGS